MKTANNEYHRTFMNNRLKIDIWKTQIGDNLFKYSWHIHYEGNSWYTYDWRIPQDVWWIAIDIWIHVDIEAAKIIYKSIIDHYNDMFVGIQNERNLITEGYVGYNMVDVINFPPFEYFEDKIRRFKGPITYAPSLSDYPISYAIDSANASDGIYWELGYIVMTHDEYEEKLANGQINQNDIYLIVN